MNARPVESVWDYPRPPRLEPAGRHLRIVHAGVVVAETREALRVLETSHPPVYYLPPIAIAAGILRRSPQRGSFCEWKGAAVYWDVDLSTLAPELPPDRTHLPSVAWSYPSPTAAFAALRDHLAFYCGRLDECTVDGERALPQPGGFYGGWITSELRGPFKGAPGTMGW